MIYIEKYLSLTNFVRNTDMCPFVTSKEKIVDKLFKTSSNRCLKDNLRRNKVALQRKNKPLKIRIFQFGEVAGPKNIYWRGIDFE